MKKGSKRMWRKAMALVLAMVLSVGNLSVTAFAAETDGLPDEDNGGGPSTSICSTAGCRNFLPEVLIRTSWTGSRIMSNSLSRATTCRLYPACPATMLRTLSLRAIQHLTVI